MNILLILFSLLPHNFHGCALSPEDLHGWAVTLDTVPLDTLSIVHTSNNGMDWEKQINPADRQYFDVTCIDSLNAWICGMSGMILSTSDGGKTWKIESDGHTKYYARIQMIDRKHGSAAGGNGVFGKFEEGMWQRVWTQWWQTDFYGVSFIDTLNGWMCGRPDTLAGGTKSHIVRSSDGGDNWELQLEDSVYDLLDVCFISKKEGWVVGGKEFTYEPIILHTEDGGVHWKQQTNIEGGYYLRSVYFVDDSTGWACGRFGTILNTIDGGESWNLQPNPADSTLFDIEFADHYRGLAVGYGALLYSFDGGENWLEGVVGIEEESHISPLFINISPNPFITKTTIDIRLETRDQNQSTSVSGFRSSVCIYDISGRLVRYFSLSSSLFSNHKIIWDGRDSRGISVPAGLYMCVLDKGGERVTKKVIRAR